MATKEKSSSGKEFARGGKTKMFGRQNAGTQKPGTTAHATSGGGGKFAKGGGKKMFGFAPTRPAKSGSTSAR